MKTSLIKTLAIASLSTAILFLSACATKGFEQAAQTKSSVQDLDQISKSLSAQIDSTNNTLQTLLDVKTGDPKAQYDSFSKALDRATSLAKDLQNKIDTIRSNSDSTVAQRRKVEATITSMELRNASKARTDEFQKKYADINNQAIKTASRVQAYLSDMSDIRKLLSTDLSISGISAAAPFAKKAMDSSNEVKKELDTLSMDAIKVAEETSYTVVDTLQTQ